jgi:hypothetical protein
MISVSSGRNMRLRADIALRMLDGELGDVDKDGRTRKEARQ